MYTPDIFAITDPEDVELILANAGIGCLVTHGPEGLFASHLPLIYDSQARTLAGHLAKANPHPRLADAGGEALVVFSGPDAYVSPSFYPSKAAHGRVVPTWNYQAVHVYGRPTWRDDPDWLRANVAALTRRFERTRPEPWSVEDAPPAYLDGMLRAITGVEIAITRLEAKRKLSQNRDPDDRRGVISGLAAMGHGSAEVAALMAALWPEAG